MAEISRLALADQAAGERLAERLAALVRPGDVIGLTGQLGAGKTTLARAFIRACARAAGVELGEVPSPTFSLVQVYELPEMSVWHVDLYRLEGPDEVFELGLEDAADDVTLLEWPERLGSAAAAGMLVLRLEPGASENGRSASLEGGGDWVRRLAGLERGQAAEEFLDNVGWGKAQRSPLAGDASFRRYERLRLGDKRAVLMDAPPPQEDVRPFITIARHLGDLGFSAPAVEAVDTDQGFVLLEDLGDDLFTHLLVKGTGEEELYAAAVDLLVELQRQPLPELPPHDDAVLWQGARLLLEWYLPAVDAAPTPAAASEYEALWRECFALGYIGNPVLVLRDYHADNLLWLPERRGLARVGLLDFQDALAGSPAYDLVSLLEDARRDVPEALAEAMIRRYLAATGFEPEAFRTAYAVLGAQRNSRIIGIFTRLCARDGKAAYLDLIPHVWGLLQRDLEHPALSALKAWFASHVPAAKRCRPPLDKSVATL